jgi:hypothetical protein
MGARARSLFESVMNTCPQSPTTMIGRTWWNESESDGSGRDPMCLMAKRNDLEGITRLLDEGVDPAADEERAYVRLMIGRCIGWKVGRASMAYV